MWRYASPAQLKDFFGCSAALPCPNRQADKAEAALRAEEHRRQLAAAAASLWQQSDRVKALAGAALLGEVLAERQRQIAGATQAAEAARRADAAFLVAQRQRTEVRLWLRRPNPAITACQATCGACMSRVCSETATEGAHVAEPSHCTAQRALGARLQAMHSSLSQVHFDSEGGCARTGGGGSGAKQAPRCNSTRGNAAQPAAGPARDPAAADPCRQAGSLARGSAIAAAGSYRCCIAGGTLCCRGGAACTRCLGKIPPHHSI